MGMSVNAGRMAFTQLGNLGTKALSPASLQKMSNAALASSNPKVANAFSAALKSPAFTNNLKNLGTMSSTGMNCFAAGAKGAAMSNAAKFMFSSFALAHQQNPDKVDAQLAYLVEKFGDSLGSIGTAAQGNFEAAALSEEDMAEIFADPENILDNGLGSMLIATIAHSIAGGAESLSERIAGGDGAKETIETASHTAEMLAGGTIGSKGFGAFLKNSAQAELGDQVDNGLKQESNDNLAGNIARGTASGIASEVAGTAFSKGVANLGSKAAVGGGALAGALGAAAVNQLMNTVGEQISPENQAQLNELSSNLATRVLDYMTKNMELDTQRQISIEPMGQNQS